MKHQDRKHSKFSASGAQRWLNCPGSVSIQEGLPDKSSPYAEEGTRAHAVLETLLVNSIRLNKKPTIFHEPRNESDEMIMYAIGAANHILDLHRRIKDSSIQVETRIPLDFIHPEMFGTFDAAIVDYFDTLHVFDFKYGAGVPVSPIGNLQMIFYGLGLAHKYDYNFKKVRLWIIQPRIKGYDGPTFWDIGIDELKRYTIIFKKGVDDAISNPHEFTEGPWCHWCRAKSICPAKQDKKLEKAREIFGRF